MSIKWAELGITKKKVVRDLWARQDLTGVDGAEYSVTVPGHGVVMLRVK